MSARAQYPLRGILLGLALPLFCRAETNRWETLLQKNPFYSASAPVEKTPQLELRGVLVEGKVTWFNLYNAATKESAWVQQGDHATAYALKDYDATQGALTLEFQQRRISVALKQSPVIPDVMPRGRGTIIPAAPAKSTPPAVAVAPPPAEIQRLEQVAAEIRFRREQELRKKAPTST